MRAWLKQLSSVQVIFVAFTATAWLGVGLLMLPFSSRGPGGSTFLEAFFTATSAVCVTGLIIVDTASHWTPFGKAVILALVQIGGFGVMTLATVIGFTVLGKLSLKARINAAAEIKSEGLDDVNRLVLGVLRITVAVEVTVAILLAARFRFGYHRSLPDSIWLGIFHAVSSFNNAGFSPFSDSMIGFALDPWICLPIMAAIVIGGLGFPVVAQLRRWIGKPLRWSMNTRLVVFMTVLLLVGGTLFFMAVEWDNPDTIGLMSWDQKLLVGAFQSVQTRTAGFESVNLADLHATTLLGMDILMFIGGGPAGTAGGIKVTTFAVLFFIIWTEIRGEGAVNVLGKRLSRAVHRQAITVALVAVGLVVGSSMAIMVLTSFGLEQVLFEVISAFGTVGLSTGITAHLGPASQLVLCFLMYVGRLGPITFAYALAMRRSRRLYELPKERPIIG